jgi:hypothetical protein
MLTINFQGGVKGAKGGKGGKSTPVEKPKSPPAAQVD